MLFREQKQSSGVCFSEILFRINIYPCLLIFFFRATVWGGLLGYHFTEGQSNGIVNAIGALPRHPHIPLAGQLVHVCFAAESWHLPPTLGHEHHLVCMKSWKMPRLLSPHAHPRAAYSMSDRYGSANAHSCSLRCHLHSSAPRRFRLSLGVPLKSLSLGSFLPLSYLASLTLLLDDTGRTPFNKWGPICMTQGVVWGTNLRQLCCFS